MNSQSYRNHIIPVVDLWMQDNAPCHKARATMAELNRRGIPLLNWPPFSPDLNPIEHVWAWMKDWLQEPYSDLQCSIGELRNRVQLAWDAVLEDFLQKLIKPMPERIN
jgi:transposase